MACSVQLLQHYSHGWCHYCFGLAQPAVLRIRYLILADARWVMYKILVVRNVVELTACHISHDIHQFVPVLKVAWPVHFGLVFLLHRHPAQHSFRKL